MRHFSEKPGSDNSGRAPPLFPLMFSLAIAGDHLAALIKNKGPRRPVGDLVVNDHRRPPIVTGSAQLTIFTWRSCEYCCDWDSSTSRPSIRARQCRACLADGARLDPPAPAGPGATFSSPVTSESRGGLPMFPGISRLSVSSGDTSRTADKKEVR